MATKPEVQMCSVAEGGMRLKRSYQATLRLLLIGSLRGHRTADGHYELERESVEELARQQAKAAGNRAAPAGAA